MTDPTETTDITPKAEVYRAKLSVDLSVNSSTGVWKYYESRESLEDDLLAAQLDVLIKRGNHPDGRHIYRRRRLWRAFLKGDNDYPKITAINAVDRFKNGTWVPLTVTFTEPAVEITESSR